MNLKVKKIGYRGQYLVINRKENSIGILFQWNNKKEIEPYEFIKEMQKI
jgi:hypothetical protein